MARSLSQLFYALGGSVSPGKSNDELIDHLIDAEFIRTPAVQRVFRSVDRGNYYHPNHRQNAYKDIAWRMGNLHLSAPCVYSVVMETLKLKPGLSFLNLGSGSGYLSTMAGLLLGQYGINHGIEFHEDIVEYAYERLDEFLKNSKVVDEHDFCEPVFTSGNCLTLDGNGQQYDRVYCGAACPEEYEGYIKNLVKINGILIMPLNDKLLKITRVSETVWTTVKVLSVSFAPLILPPPTKKGVVRKYAQLGDFNPPTLQQLCRFKVRGLLRNNIEAEHPKLKDIQSKLPSRRGGLKLFIVNCGDEADVEDSESDNEDSDSFTLLMRSLHRTSYLLRSFHQVESSSEQHDESEEDFEEVLKFASLTTVRDAAEEEVESNEEEGGLNAKVINRTLTVSQDQAMQINDRLSDIERRSKSDSKNGEVGNEANSEASDGTSKVEKEAKDYPKTGKRSKSTPKTGVEMDATVDPKTSGGQSKAKKVVDAQKSSSSSFDLPPSQSTRSRTSTLKRKHSSLVDGPSTSAGYSSRILKRISRKSTPKKQKTASPEPKKQLTKEVFSRAVKLDSNNRIAEEFSHTYFLTQKIAALPLPPYLRKYMNYKRDNF